MIEHGPQDASAQDPAAQGQDDGWEWAIVEIFGHRRHAGRIREDERFGSKMLRIDVPKGGAAGWETLWYGGASIFSLTLTDEATARRLNRPLEPAARFLPDFSHDGDDDDRPF